MKNIHSSSGKGSMEGFVLLVMFIIIVVAVIYNLSHPNIKTYEVTKGNEKVCYIDASGYNVNKSGDLIFYVMEYKSVGRHWDMMNDEWETDYDWVEKTSRVFRSNDWIDVKEVVTKKK